VAATWKVHIDLSALLALPQQLQADAEAALRGALHDVAQGAMAAWKDAVWKAKLWQGIKQPYVESIHWRFTGDLSAEVWTDYDQALLVETGRPQRDLKLMLNTSARVRVNSKGGRYLIIPFRHNMAALEAAGAYAEAKQLKASTVISKGWRPSGTGAYDVKTHKPMLVPSSTYAWGGSMKSDNPQLNRLYRFNTSAGAGKRSDYLTFRTMVEGSPKWLVPAQPGLYLAKKVADDLQGSADAMFAAAIAGSQQS